MKKHLTILSVLFAALCNGQIPKQYSLPYDADTTMYVDSAWLSYNGSGVIVERNRAVTFDTIPCLIQYSDTGRYVYTETIPVYTGTGYSNGIADFSNTTFVRMDTTGVKVADYDWSVTYMIGWEVREKHCCINGNTSNLAYYQAVPYYIHKEYLDENKKPLKSSIVVWMAKN